MAYARWLAAQIREVVPEGYTVRLPTEAEWEKAARVGDNRRYPWGDEDWGKECANVYESRIGHANPVGMYPHGVTPADIHEMAGNVWEWTASLYKSYPYHPDDGWKDPDAEGDRVLRGGSWLYNRRVARCACRFRFAPDLFDSSVGFRVVVSLVDSVF